MPAARGACLTGDAVRDSLDVRLRRSDPLSPCRPVRTRYFLAGSGARLTRVAGGLGRSRM
jgi:hypothetical protein